MSLADPQAQIGRAIAEFALNEQYPEDEATISSTVDSSALLLATELLSAARSSLIEEIRRTSREAAPNVDTWITQAKALQGDIEKTEQLGKEIIRLAQADENREDLINEQTVYVSFIEKEVEFNRQVHGALLSAQEAYQALEKADSLLAERRILAGLQTLDIARAAKDAIPIDPTALPLRLLEGRLSDSENIANTQLHSIWENLVLIDHVASTVTIHESLSGEPTTLKQTVMCLEQLKRTEEFAKDFWRSINEVIIVPRIDRSGRANRAVFIEQNTLKLGAETEDMSMKSLLASIQAIIVHLGKSLPSEFVLPLSEVMMPTLSARLKDYWLDSSVPSELDELPEYEKELIHVNDFVESLQALSWPGTDMFQDWVAEAPKNWITKKREMVLDWTRSQLELGIGASQSVTHSERQLVTMIEETNDLSVAENPDWDSAWDDDETTEQPQKGATERVPATEEAKNDDDDAAEEWGWGEEGDGENADGSLEEKQTQPAPQTKSSKPNATPRTEEITLSEKYCISSMPQAVFQVVSEFFNDAARLTSPEFVASRVQGVAPVLFNLPTLVFAMYRALSPVYYAKDACGNMYAYNDSRWICEKLEKFSSEWQCRTDLSPKAQGRVKLDSEIQKLKSFGKRAYANELNAQRTIITDLLGGAQNFFQEDGEIKANLENEVEGLLRHIRTVAASWQPVLAYSAWASAVGSLVNTVAGKIIGDVFDFSDLSVDGAESVATLISSMIRLDDLFIQQPGLGADGTHAEDSEPIPMTAQFADKWMKLKFLVEVLQCNLADIKMYWFDSDLGLYFTVEEVVELIGLSFANNAYVRQTVKEIRERPNPRED